jgi:hypothetical protein
MKNIRYRMLMVIVIFSVISTIGFPCYCLSAYNSQEIKNIAMASDMERLREILTANPEQVEEIVSIAVNANPDLGPAIAELVAEIYPYLAADIAALITEMMPRRALEIYKATVDGISSVATDIQKFATDSDKYSDKIRKYDYDVDEYIRDTKEKVKEVAKESGVYSSDEFDQLVTQINAYEPPTRYIPPKNPIIRDYFHRPNYAK